jgi:hypothetical protein
MSWVFFAVKKDLLPSRAEADFSPNGMKLCYDGVNDLP